MKRKFLLAMSLVIFLSIVATIIIYVEKYQTSQEFETNKYKKEVEDVLNLVENQQVLKILKKDLNADDTKDFVILLGKEKPIENTTSEDTKDSKESKTTVKSDEIVYQNVEIVVINGVSKDVTKYETSKEFDSGIDFNIYEDKNGKYIFVNDTESGNLILLSYKDNAFSDLIKDNFGDDFKGYDITAGFDAVDTTKVKLKLDNQGVNYLTEKKDEYTLDYIDTKITSDKYRTGYSRNKYTSYILENVGEDGFIRLTATQNILYLNNTVVEVLPKTAGTVKTMFKLDGTKFAVEGVLVKE